MPRQMPTTLRPRIARSSPRRSLLHHVPNRRPRFPTSTPPPEPSAHPSGFSIRSQQGSISFNPTTFKTPVRTSIATEFNSGEHAYNTIKPRSPSIRKPRQIRSWNSLKNPSPFPTLFTTLFLTAINSNLANS